MKTNVKGSAYDWLLKLSRVNNDGSYEFQLINYCNKTKEEIMTIADSYFSSYIVVRIYKLEDILLF